MFFLFFGDRRHNAHLEGFDVAAAAVGEESVRFLPIKSHSYAGRNSHSEKEGENHRAGPVSFLPYVYHEVLTQNFICSLILQL